VEGEEREGLVDVVVEVFLEAVFFEGRGGAEERAVTRGSVRPFVDSSICFRLDVV
jgi:hypothetical protein